MLDLLSRLKVPAFDNVGSFIMHVQKERYKSTFLVISGNYIYHGTIRNLFGISIRFI